MYVKSLLPPATKLGQGNIFRSVCQEFCPQGGAWQGGMRGRGGIHRGRAWCMHGGCMAGGMAGGCAWQILRDTVNERTVRILLECILVTSKCLKAKMYSHTQQIFSFNESMTFTVLVNKPDRAHKMCFISLLF